LAGNYRIPILLVVVLVVLGFSRDFEDDDEN
jgi:hypothetical protein